MTSNINTISADIAIFDDLTIFVISFSKKWVYIIILWGYYRVKLSLFW